MGVVRLVVVLAQSSGRLSTRNDGTECDQHIGRRRHQHKHPFSTIPRRASIERRTAAPRKALVVNGSFACRGREALASGRGALTGRRAMLQNRSRFGEYLRARRAVVQPEDVGIARDPSRRVTGLRREEVARLAGISAEYYLRLEQGRARQPSHQVLSSLAEALCLDADAIVYLRRLARHLEEVSKRGPADPPDAATMSFVRQARDVGVLLIDMNLDVVSMNPVATALLPGLVDGTRNVLLELARSSGRPAKQRDREIARLLPVLRFISNPHDARLQEIVGELSVSSPAFSSLWARHDVRQPGRFPASIVVDVLGVVPLDCQMMFLPSGDHAIVTFAGAGTDDAAGRAAMAYLQKIGEERARQTNTPTEASTLTGMSASR